MPQLPSDRSYIFSEETDENSPNSVQTMQKIGSAINFLNDTFQQFEEFTSSGTFNVPEGVTKVLLYGWGGGGGGNHVSIVSRGSSGAKAYTKIVNVTPLSAVPVTIGAGAAGVTGSSAASAGGNTTFGSISTFEGGSGATIELESIADDSTRSLARVLFSISTNSVSNTHQSYSGTRGYINFESGTTRIGPEPHNGFVPSNTANDFLRGGTGGGGLGGIGAAGGGNASSAAVNTGGGGGSTTGGGSGGNGGSGYLIVAYSLA